jgi:trigger factor
MAAGVTTTTKSIGESRVRVEVEVGSEAIESAMQSAARTLSGELKVPGFRKGHVPEAVVIQRLGRETVLDEAVRRALPGWYEAAVHEAGIVTVGSPDLDLSELPEKGEPLEFSIEVGVRPEARLGEYKGLEVPRRAAEVPDEDVERELERLRDSVASLETVDRAAAKGDFLVLDFVGRVDGQPFEGGEARGHLLELGSDRFVEGFEEQLERVAAGEERTVTVTFPEDHPAEQVAGRQAEFAVTVKEVKEKRLPELDDDFAAEAGGFDTLEELRDDIRSRLRALHEERIEAEFREAAVDAAVARAEIDVPKELVHAKAHEMWEGTKRRLRAQGVDPEQYVRFTGKDEHDLIDEAEPEAEKALRRESVLAAVVAAEGIEVSDDDMLDSLRSTAAPGEKPPSDAKLRRSLDKAKADGRAELLREDIAMRKALDVIVEHAESVEAERAAARDKLWTPEKEGEERAGQIWTPGSAR